MSGWSFAGIWEAIARQYPTRPAQCRGAKAVSWGEFERDAAGLAGSLADAGIAPGDSVAEYLTNGPEYLQAVFGCFKVGATPVNTNYRYRDHELRQIWGDADVRAVVFEDRFADACARLRPVMPGVRLWLWVDRGAGVPCPPWAVPFAAASAGPAVRHRPPSGDDRFIIYTGGTTGVPRGVVWRQDDLLRMIESAAPRPLPETPDPVAHAARLDRSGPTMVVGAPLMHGTALWLSMAALDWSGCVVTLTDHHFDAGSLLDTATRHRAQSLCIVGDAFARPMVEALDAEPDRFDLSSLRAVLSSGVMFSAAAKEGLLRHAPRARIVDTLGSSESGVLARSVTNRGDGATTARFVATDRTRVIDEEGNDIPAGSGRSGRLAVTGNIPLGYLNDPERTAATFLVIEGNRYVVAGDWARVEADGSITLLGRGSACINTGGEKVFPEEVEEAIKRVRGVHDAAVVGVPDERLGSMVVALVELGADSNGVRPDGILSTLRRDLASYKVPRRLFFVPSLGRSPNGKLDHQRLREVARSFALADDKVAG